MLAQYLLSESKLEMGLHQEHGHKKRSHDPNACDKGCKTAIPSMQTIKWFYLPVGCLYHEPIHRSESDLPNDYFVSLNAFPINLS